MLLGLSRARGATLLMVTHDAAVARLADRVLELREGRLPRIVRGADGARMRTLAAASLRHLTRHPAQLALAFLGLTLGVGTIVAVDIATASAQRAFALSLQAVNGAATHQVVGGPAGLDESVYVELRRHPLVPGQESPPIAPLVSGYVTVGARTLSSSAPTPWPPASSAHRAGAARAACPRAPPPRGPGSPGKARCSCPMRPPPRCTRPRAGFPRVEIGGVRAARRTSRVLSDAARASTT